MQVRRRLHQGIEPRANPGTLFAFSTSIRARRVNDAAPTPHVPSQQYHNRFNRCCRADSAREPSKRSDILRPRALVFMAIASRLTGPLEYPPLDNATREIRHSRAPLSTQYNGFTGHN